jgi:hypothetical protein
LKSIRHRNTAIEPKGVDEEPMTMMRASDEQRRAAVKTS